MDSYLQNIRQKVGNDEVKLVGFLVLVFNQEGQVLLHQDASSKTWSLPKGIVDSNETPADGALRGVKQQTGLSLFELDMFAFTSKHESNRVQYSVEGDLHAHSFLFSSTDWEGELSTGDSELNALAFFNLNDLPEIMPNMANAIELFLRWLPEREFIFN